MAQKRKAADSDDSSSSEDDEEDSILALAERRARARAARTAAARPPSPEASSRASPEAPSPEAPQTKKKKKGKKKRGETSESSPQQPAQPAKPSEKASSKSVLARSSEQRPGNQQRTLACGVVVQDLVVGRGPPTSDRKKVSVEYVGRLGAGSAGKVFDRSSRGKPLSFRLGRGDVIKGWDIGVRGMKVGGKRRITCPPAAAYGPRKMPGKVPIPANSTLTFDVTLRKA